MSLIPAAAPSRMTDEERAAVRAAVSSVVDGDRWVLGPVVERFEREFADYLGGTEVVGTANGTDAIAIALAALDLPPGSGVLVAANEGGYAATACRMTGLVPVSVDVDEVAMLPSATSAQAAMRSGVTAIVVTHLHGEAPDISELDAWRRRAGIMLVEDCAQAAGARRDGAHVGLRGEAATFSFYPTKNLGAIGDAGAVHFADPAAAARARRLREYGWGDRFRVELAGGRNSRLDTLQAAVLSARLPFLDERNALRREIAQRYAAAVPAGARYFGDPATTVAHHAVVITAERPSLQRVLDERQIQWSVHYPFLLDEMPGLRVERAGMAPVAARLCDRILSLPSYPELADQEVSRIVATLEEWGDEAT